MAEIERTVINLRGYCLFCLGKIDASNCNSNQSPISSSPLGTPLRTSCYHNVHSFPLEERIAPFRDLCRYLGVDIPDCYAFGDGNNGSGNGSEPEMLTPPLCKKCHGLSARLCLLQDELQYLQTRIGNAKRRIYQRVAATCDGRRGELKKESFEKEFGRKSKGKGSLSRGRAEGAEGRKVTGLVKTFQMKVMEKEHELATQRNRRETTFISLQSRNPESPPPLPEPDLQIEVVDLEHEQCLDENLGNKENGNGLHGEISNVEGDVDDETETETDVDEERYLPLEETLRSMIVVDEDVFNAGCEFEVGLVEDADQVKAEITKPDSEVSTMMCPSDSRDGKERDTEENGWASADDDRDNCDYDGHNNGSDEPAQRVTRARARKRLVFAAEAETVKLDSNNEICMHKSKRRKRNT